MAEARNSISSAQGLTPTTDKWDLEKTKKLLCNRGNSKVTRMPTGWEWEKKKSLPTLYLIED